MAHCVGFTGIGFILRKLRLILFIVKRHILFETPISVGYSDFLRGP